LDLDRILQRCDSLSIVDRLVSDFAGMLRQLRGQHLDSWINTAQASGISQLAGFAAGLLKDYDAASWWEQSRHRAQARPNTPGWLTHCRRLCRAYAVDFVKSP
jgi:hypothetical protein